MNQLRETDGETVGRALGFMVKVGCTRLGHVLRIHPILDTRGLLEMVQREVGVELPDHVLAWGCSYLASEGRG